jgi:hypothetical protein
MTLCNHVTTDYVLPAQKHLPDRYIPCLINKFQFNRYILLPNNSVGQDIVGLVFTETRYGWTARGSNPGGGSEIFCTRPDLAWGPPTLL